MQIIRPLSSSQTKAGDKLFIKHVNAMGNTPAMLFYLRQYLELNEAGLAHPVLTANNNSSAVYAEINNTIVGIIVYRLEDDPLKTTWKILSAVDEHFRGRGIYRAMHSALERHVATMGSKKIASHVHLNNLPAQKSNGAVGLEPVWFKMEKTIK